MTDDAGAIYYSLDQGTTWVLSTAVPGGATILHDIQFASNSVGYVCGHLNDVGMLWRTYSSGNTWVTMPDGVGILPVALDLNALAACEFDENFVVTVGEGAVANDGIIITAALWLVTIWST